MSFQSFLSCAFCEQRGHLAASLFILLRPRIARAQRAVWSTCFPRDFWVLLDYLLWQETIPGCSGPWTLVHFVQMLLRGCSTCDDQTTMLKRRGSNEHSWSRRNTVSVSGFLSCSLPHHGGRPHGQNPRGLGERGAADGRREHQCIGACVPGISAWRLVGGAPLPPPSRTLLSGHGHRVVLHALEPVPEAAYAAVFDAVGQGRAWRRRGAVPPRITPSSSSVARSRRRGHSSSTSRRLPASR